MIATPLAVQKVIPYKSRRKYIKIEKNKEFPENIRKPKSNASKNLINHIA